MTSLSSLNAFLRDCIHACKERPKLIRFGWLPKRHPFLSEKTIGFDIQLLVDSQLNTWRHRPRPCGRSLLTKLDAVSETTPSLSLLRIDGQRVRMASRPSPQLGKLPKTMRRMLTGRVRAYCTLVRSALRWTNRNVNVTLAIDVADLPENYADVPVFSFQKRTGYSNILMPDVDFFNGLWYRNFGDPVPYADKRTHACFYGSSTGGIVRMSDLGDAACCNERIELAKDLHGNPWVTFKIANATQCDSEETRKWLEQSPFFSKPVDWREQLQNRFIVSVDGNGATCSRVILALMSNSVLVKYRSDSELFYFPALTAGEHYLAAESGSEIEAIVRGEEANPGQYRSIAESGRRFAKRYLTQGSVLAFTGALISEYEHLFSLRTPGNIR